MNRPWTNLVSIPALVAILFATTSTLTAYAMNDDDDVTAKPDLPQWDPVQFRKLVATGKIDEAIRQIDARLVENDHDASLHALNITLATTQMRTNREQGQLRLHASTKVLCDMQPLPASAFSPLILAANSLMAQPNTENMALLWACHSKLDAAGPAALSAKRSVESMLANALIRLGKKDEALAILNQSFEQLVENLEPDDIKGIRAIASAVNAYSSLAGDLDPRGAQDKYEMAEKMSLKLIDAPNLTPEHFGPLYDLKAGLAARNVYRDPASAMKTFEGLQEVFHHVSEKMDEGQLKQLNKLHAASIKSLGTRIESAMVRERLVGTSAPEFDANSFVGMDPTTMEGLRGKVVLLDFWAVWCGPCIATFPHLKHLHEAYSDQGLVILGITRDYGYSWNDETQKAIRGENVSHEDELAMLEKFREYHGLKHGFVVTSQSGEYNKSFAVSGIPQAVVLDKKGNIQMIRVGSGAKNSEDLESKIKDLLAQE